MRNSAIILLLILISGASLGAQSRFEVAGGYQFMRDQDIAKSDADLSANFPAGWMVSGGASLSGWLVAVGEVSGSMKTLNIPGDKPKLRVYTFMAGPRIQRRRRAGLNPFGEVLFGSARASTSVLSVHETVTDFSYQPGGGVDLNTTDRFGVRLEGYYRLVHAAGGTTKEPGFIAAAVFAF